MFPKRALMTEGVRKLGSLRIPAKATNSLCFCYAVTVLMTVIMFIWITRLNETPARAFSPNIGYRLQTEAFAKGRLALQESPFGNRQDWVWGKKGYHQIWGLGVPLLRFPFEVLSKMAHGTGFPDRLTFIFYYGLATFFLIRAFRQNIRESAEPRLNVARSVQTYIWPAMIMLSPPFLNLIYTRFDVYEEVVAYGNLWALILLALLMIIIARPSDRCLYALSLASGYAFIIRPTLSMYGLLTFVIGQAYYFRKPEKRKAVIIATVLFSIFPILLLILNKVRFGSFLEFGYSLNMSSIPVNDFALRFGYPFQSEPWLRAARELFSIIFCRPEFNYHDMFKFNYFMGQSPTLRFREFYFHTFDLAWLLLMFFSIPVTYSIYRLKAHSADIPLRRMFLALAVWSWCNFVGLFLFYSRCPAISSRYIMDFFPAMAGFFALASMGLVHWMRFSKGMRAEIWATAGVILVLISWFSISFYRDLVTTPRGRQIRNLTGDEVALRIKTQRESSERARLINTVPGEYRCPSPNLLFGIRSNGTGWDYEKTCGVGPITVVFLKPSPCVELWIRKEPLADLNKLLPSIKVKSNLEMLFLFSKKEGKNGAIMTFCSDSDHRTDTLPRLVSVGWVDPSSLSVIGPPLKMESIRAVEKSLQ